VRLLAQVFLDIIVESLRWDIRRQSMAAFHRRDKISNVLFSLLSPFFMYYYSEP
jgi:hypothetical protein